MFVDSFTASRYSSNKVCFTGSQHTLNLLRRQQYTPPTVYVSSTFYLCFVQASVASAAPERRPAPPDASVFDDDGPQIRCVLLVMLFARPFVCFLRWPRPLTLLSRVRALRPCVLPFDRVVVRKRPLSTKEKNKKEVDVIDCVEHHTLLVHEPKYDPLPSGAWALVASYAQTLRCLLVCLFVLLLHSTR